MFSRLFDTSAPPESVPLDTFYLCPIGRTGTRNWWARRCPYHYIRRIWIILLLIIAGTLLTLSLTALDMQEQWAVNRAWNNIEDRGVTVTGTLLETDSDAGTVTYRFTPPDATDTITTTQTVPQSLLTDLSADDDATTLEVLVHPGRPQVHRLTATETPDRPPVQIPPFTLLMLIPLPFLMIYGLHWLRFVLRGRLIQGEITSFDTIPGPDGIQAVEIFYRFTLPERDSPLEGSGQRSIKTFTTGWDDLPYRQKPRAGQPLVMWYLNDRTYQVL